MPDTPRTLAALEALLADNTAGDISAQDIRDFLVSVALITGTGELGGTADAPTVNATHSGSAHHAQSHGNADHTTGVAPADVTKAAAAEGTNAAVARADHKHDVSSAAAGASAFGDSAAEGTATALARSDHRHSREANPVTAHEAAGDPHTGYRLESADHSHQSTGAQAGQLDHGLALTGLADDDHSAYLLASDATNRATFAANWLDLTDGGASTLHSHAGGSGHTIRENGVDQTARAALNFIDTDAGAGLITDDAGGGETEVNLNLYVLKSVLTTRGDIYRRGASTVERLPTASDRKAVMFDGTDASYQYVVETGVYASRPAASTANVGRLYLATDRQNTLYRCKDATTWEIVNPRRLRLEWYVDGRQYMDKSNRQGPIRRLPSDMGPWKPIRATANLKTAPTEGANRTGTATSGSTTTLVDSGKSWTIDQWKGAVCSITAGTNNGKKGRVASNTATQLTFEDAFSAAIDATSVYSIESGIRVQFESGSSATPSTNSFTEPASDTTTDNRLTITPTNVENTASTFAVTSYAADDRVEMLVDGVGADANGATGEDLTVVLELEQADG